MSSYKIIQRIFAIILLISFPPAVIVHYCSIRDEESATSREWRIWDSIEDCWTHWVEDCWH